MRLIEQKSRNYGDKEYFKYIVVLPSKIVKQLGWKAGEDLEVEVQGKKLVIERD